MNNFNKNLKRNVHSILAALWLGSQNYNSQLSSKILPRRNPLNYHNFHILKPSVWPFAAALSLLLLAFGLVNWFYSGKTAILVIGLVQVIFVVFFWWSDVSQESGETTEEIVKNLKLGMALFIVSEVMFFFSFFWAFFQVSLVPGHEIGGVWPPVGLETIVIDPWSVPLLNTILLLSSGVTVTCAHHALLYYFETEKLLSAVSFSNIIIRLKKQNYFTFENVLLILILLKKQAIKLFFLGVEMLVITITLALLFTALQLYEYIESLIRISDSAYGSTFFVMTGFHGLHVIVGTIFLTVCLFRLAFNHFYYKASVGLEASIWYWHFVDVIWILLYITVYMWGNKQTKTKIKKEDFWGNAEDLQKRKEYEIKLNAKKQADKDAFIAHVNSSKELLVYYAKYRLPDCELSKVKDKDGVKWDEVFEKQNLSAEDLVADLKKKDFHVACEPFGVETKPTPKDWNQNHYKKAPKGFKHLIEDLEKRNINEQFNYIDNNSLEKCHYNIKTYISKNHIAIMETYLKRKDVRSIEELRKLPEFQKYKHESNEVFIVELLARLKCNKEFAADRQLIAAEVYGIQNFKYPNSCNTFFSDNPEIRAIFKKNPKFSYDDLLKLDRPTQKKILNHYYDCYQKKKDFSKNLTNEAEINLIISYPRPTLDNWVISRIYRSIKSKIFGKSIAKNDFAAPGQYGFQDSATPIMDGISDLHHRIMAYLILIFIAVSWFLIACFLNKENRRMFINKKANLFESLKYFFNYHVYYINDKYKRFRVKEKNGDYLLIELFLPVYLKSKKRWIIRTEVISKEGKKLLKADQLLLEEGFDRLKKSYPNSKNRLKNSFNKIKSSLKSGDRKIILAQLLTSFWEIKEELNFFANEIDVQRVVFCIKHKEHYEVFKKALKNIRYTKKIEKRIEKKNEKK